MIKPLVVVASGGALAFALAGTVSPAMAWGSVHPPDTPTVRDSSARFGCGHPGQLRLWNPGDPPTVRDSTAQAAPPTVRDSKAKTSGERWNGSAWKQVPSPSPGRASSLTSVAATSASNVWAVGDFSNDGLSRVFAIHCC
jgi:hypothetical protein